MKLTKTELKKCLECANKRNSFYFGVLIENADLPSPEIIINSKGSFDGKLEYYDNAYNEDLTLKMAPDKIKIINYCFGNTIAGVVGHLL